MKKNTVPEKARYVRVGIDIGGPIIARNSDEADTVWHSDKFMDVPAVDGSFEGIKNLVNHYGPQNVWLISKGRALHQPKTRVWLDEHNFFERTGVKSQNVIMCIHRDDKAIICEDLEITDMIDDRLQILGKLPTVPRPYLIHGRDKDMRKYRPALNRVIQARDWHQLIMLIVKSR